MEGLNSLKPLSGKIVQNIIGKKKHGGRNDWDFDGVPNKRDCQPRNTMRQDLFNYGLPSQYGALGDAVIIYKKGNNALWKRAYLENGVSYDVYTATDEKGLIKNSNVVLRLLGDAGVSSGGREIRKNVVWIKKYKG